MVRLLIGKGACANSIRNKEYKTPLHDAATAGHADIIEVVNYIHVYVHLS